jgi:hypothetical protein
MVMYMLLGYAGGVDSFQGVPAQLVGSCGQHYLACLQS